MSHVAAVELQILDIAALKSAVEKAGCQFIEGQTSHKWYGRRIDSRDTNIKSEDFGKCEHAIRIPGVNYEIGVTRHASGKGYALAFDNFGNDQSGRGHDGQRIAAKFGGPELPALKQGYATSVAKRELARKGYRVTEVRKANGSIVLQAVKS